MSAGILDRLDLSGRRKLPIILQAEAAECGLACLAMVASFHGHNTNLIALRRQFAISLKGVTLKTLMGMAARIGLAPRAVRLELEEMTALRTPAILHWDLKHFVVLKSANARTITVHDPAHGLRTYRMTEASKHFTGVALELTPTPELTPRRSPPQLRLGTLFGPVAGLGPALAQLGALALVLQVLALINPFFMQTVVDDVVVNGDRQLLAALAVGFVFLGLSSAAISALRSYVSLYAGSSLSYHTVIRLFRRMIHLPLSFFERRHLGDIVSRFGSTQPIQQFLTQGVVSVFIDGVMALATLAMMTIYSGLLALISFGALLLYAAARFAFYGILRGRNESLISVRALENSTFMESVRGIAAIKMFGREEERQHMWQDRFADSINEAARVQRLQIMFDVTNAAIFAIENVAVIYLAATLVLDQTFSVGMIFAFMSYKTSFLQSGRALIERGIEFRLLGLHLDRLADIALAREETQGQSNSLLEKPLLGRIELRDVSFRYGDGEPWVLRGVSLVIEPGSMSMIVGPSGAGKTTLLKIILGLVAPSEGEVLIDGIPLHAYGLAAYRSRIGAVLQDDILFAGSIVENIAFFDAEPDIAHVEVCAQAAQIHDEISRMPMGYQSLVGDMGTTLSGGQRQRVLLARALYRKPAVLFLDEGMAHIDPANAAAISRRLESLSATIVAISHGPSQKSVGGQTIGAISILTLQKAVGAQT